jgi:type IV pilus assembly protein PilA
MSSVPQTAPAEAQAQERRTPALAIVALVLAFIPFLLHLVGGILGIVALVKISGDKQRYKGGGLAIAAIVVGFGWIVLAIPAAIAIPNFMKFQARAKQSEAKFALKAIYTSEKSVMAEGGSFVPLSKLGWQPDGPTRYTIVLGDEAIEATMGEQLRVDVESYVRADGFKALAIANLDQDDTLDVWSIDQNNELVNLSDDTKN